MESLAGDLEVALGAARAAGEAVMAHFRGGGEVRYKGPEQPVTDADLAADRVLRETLLGARPDYGWLSEETRDSPDRLSRRRLWVVDPIDGTNSFVKGLAEFAICIGLVDGGDAVLGIVYNPAAGELYHAVRGGGAFLNGAPIHVSTTVDGDDARRVLGSRSEIRRGELEYFAGGWSVEGLGSTAYKMAKVAEGAADVFVSSGPKNEWDVCAPDVLLREAGGRASHLDGSPFRYNQPETGWRGVAATNGALHDAVLALTQQARG